MQAKDLLPFVPSEGLGVDGLDHANKRVFFLLGHFAFCDHPKQIFKVESPNIEVEQQPSELESLVFQTLLKQQC